MTILSPSPAIPFSTIAHPFAPGAKGCAMVENGMAGLGDKIVIVTGASGGLGAACAEAFAAAQCRVALAARDAQKLRASAERIARKGGQALAVACDVTRRDEVIRLGAAVRAAWGDAQVLVNCAGIARAARFTEMAD